MLFRWPSLLSKKRASITFVQAVPLARGLRRACACCHLIQVWSFPDSILAIERHYAECVDHVHVRSISGGGSGWINELTTTTSTAGSQVGYVPPVQAAPGSGTVVVTQHLQQMSAAPPVTEMER
jgi:hypothetical protein